MKWWEYDKLVKEDGIEIGKELGREEIFASVYDKDYSMERGVEKLKLSVELFREKYNKWLEKEGRDKA